MNTATNTRETYSLASRLILGPIVAFLVCSVIGTIVAMVSLPLATFVFMFGFPAACLYIIFGNGKYKKPAKTKKTKWVKVEVES